MQVTIFEQFRLGSSKSSDKLIMFSIVHGCSLHVDLLPVRKITHTFNDKLNLFLIDFSSCLSLKG